MSQLKIILMDVAWGDSIFLESTDSNGNEHYAVIDSNDTTYNKQSFLFLKKYFQRKFNSSNIDKPLLDWVMLSHAHMDHGEGLKEIMRFFGTQNFFYPKSISNSSLAHLQNYANRVKIAHQAIDNSRDFSDFGDAKIEILWPRYNEISSNENDNSIVLKVSINEQSCIFSGDAEEHVWDNIAHLIPEDTVFFKVPHHGSKNGSLDSNGNGTWTNQCPKKALLGVSTHNRPYNHPHQEVLTEFEDKGLKYLRTDENYHLEIVLNSDGIRTKYSKWDKEEEVTIGEGNIDVAGLLSKHKI